MSPERQQQEVANLSSFFGGMGVDERGQSGLTQTNIALGFLLVEVQGLGYASDPMLGFDQVKVKEILNLPAHVKFAGMVPLGDLRTDSFVLFPKGYVLRKIAVEACHAAGFEPKITSEGEDMDALKGLVSAGIGVSLLPESTFYDSIPRFTVKVPIDTPKAMRTVGIIIPKHRDIAPAEKNFYQFLIQYFNRLDQYK